MQIKRQLRKFVKRGNKIVRVLMPVTARLTLKQRLKELKTVLRYDKRTGHFHWKIYTIGHGELIKPGDVAGTRGTGYVCILYTHSDGIKRRYRAHRLAWWFVKGKMPREVDHKNRKRSDNRWINLRRATRTYNNINAELRSDNQSGYAGVSRRGNKWHARITKRGKTRLLGDFETVEEAIAVRKIAERELYGDFKYDREANDNV